MNKKLLPLIVIVAVVAGGVWWFYRTPESSPEEQLTGNIEMTTVDITFPVGGRLLEVGAEEGERVSRGQVLGRLDPTQLKAVYQQTRAKLESLRARMEETEESLRFQQATMETQVALAGNQKAEAEARLNELRNGSRSEEIAQGKAAVEEAEAAWEQAQQDWERMQELFKTGDVSQQQLDRSESAAVQGQARVERAQKNLQLLEEGPRQERIQAAEAAVAQASSAIEQARARRFEIARVEKSRKAQASEAAALEAELERLRAALDDLVAESPIDGIVLTRNAEPGEVVSPTEPILRLADTARPWIRAYIPEAMLGRIQLGTPVEVRTDSYPDKVYSGRISFISDEAEFTPKQIQTQEQRVRWVYRIKIQVENPAGELKLNMPCDARVASRETHS